MQGVGHFALAVPGSALGQRSEIIQTRADSRFDPVADVSDGGSGAAVGPVQDVDRVVGKVAEVHRRAADVQHVETPARGAVENLQVGRPDEVGIRGAMCTGALQPVITHGQENAIRTSVQTATGEIGQTGGGHANGAQRLFVLCAEN